MARVFRLYIDDRCGGCNWRAAYVYAESRVEAEGLLESGEAGLCGDRLCDMLAEEGYEVNKVGEVSRRK